MARTKGQQVSDKGGKQPRLPAVQKALLHKLKEKSKLNQETGASAGVRKPHRYRPGTRVRMDARKIRKVYQAKPVVKRGPFLRLLKHLWPSDIGLRVTSAAVDHLRQWVDRCLHDVLVDATRGVIRARRKKLRGVDVLDAYMQWQKGASADPVFELATMPTNFEYGGNCIDVVDAGMKEQACRKWFGAMVADRLHGPRAQLVVDGYGKKDKS